MNSDLCYSSEYQKLLYDVDYQSKKEKLEEKKGKCQVEQELETEKLQKIVIKEKDDRPPSPLHHNHNVKNQIKQKILSASSSTNNITKLAHLLELETQEPSSTSVYPGWEKLFLGECRMVVDGVYTTLNPNVINDYSATLPVNKFIFFW
jgi:hypothetical protein